MGHVYQDTDQTPTRQTRHSLWKRSHHKCYIIDICVCLDVNIDNYIEQYLNNYLPLAVELKQLYPEYSFEVLPVTIGATGLFTNRIVQVFKTPEY